MDTRIRLSLFILCISWLRRRIRCGRWGCLTTPRLGLLLIIAYEALPVKFWRGIARFGFRLARARHPQVGIPKLLHRSLQQPPDLRLHLPIQPHEVAHREQREYKPRPHRAHQMVQPLGHIVAILPPRAIDKVAPGRAEKVAEQNRSQRHAHVGVQLPTPPVADLHPQDTEPVEEKQRWDPEGRNPNSLIYKYPRNSSSQRPSYILGAHPKGHEYILPPQALVCRPREKMRYKGQQQVNAGEHHE